MKKHVLSTSAIALGVAMAAPASAQDWNLDWGGFMSQHIAYADVSHTQGAGDANALPTAGADFDGIGFHSNTEIIFSPSVTLDNGLTFGVNVQLEGDNSGGARVDETYMTISSDSLGRIVIGSENSAGYLSMVGAPGVVSMGINSPSISAFVPLSGSATTPGGPLPGGFRGAMFSTWTEVGRNNDVDRLTYFTPSFNGLTIGVSYARNDGGNSVTNHNNNAGVGLEDIFDIGVNYSGSFGGTDVSLGARWGTADNTAAGASDASTWGVGAQFGFGAFTVGGSYAENETGVGGAASGDQNGWSFGVAYDAAGPWSFGLQTYQGESEGTGVAAGADEEYIAYSLGASRDMGPGVSMDIYAIFVEAEDKGAGGTKTDGTVIGTAINLSF